MSSKDASVGTFSETYHDMVVLDTHTDTVLRWVDLKHDLTVARDDGYFDLPSIRRGNIAGAFFACCVEPEYVAAGRGADRLTHLLDGVADFAARNEPKVGLARTAEDILRLRAEGRFAVLPAVEGAQGIGADLGRLEDLRRRGVSYVSPTHFSTNDWADSSTDVARHHGVSALGREAIAELNRLGILIDLSHISDEAFWDTLDLSTRPVFASHSSARTLAAHPRNLTDEMIRAVADQGGLIGVTWWPEYVSERYGEELERRASEIRRERPEYARTTSAIATLLSTIGDDAELKYNVLRNAGVRFPTLDDVLDHVDHVVAVAGADAVCIGTDHGACDFRIEGLESCDRFEALAAGLVARGHRVDDVGKIVGGNVVRFLAEAQAC